MTVTSSTDSSCKQVWPPGFRFHPTDEELVLYYLKRKICGKPLKLDIIGVLDVYKWDPHDLPGKSLLKTGDRQWFFFSPRDRKYPNGGRSNRATEHGYWKATGKDRNITCKSRTVGVKKTLVFYRGRAPSGERTDWVMHEHTLDEEELQRCQTIGEYYALYKVYKKSGPGPKNGEQYGAPFEEEEWADDELPEVNKHTFDDDNPGKQLNDITIIDNTRVNVQLQDPLHDLDEILRRIVDDPVPHQPSDSDYADELLNVLNEEGTQNTMAHSLVRDGVSVGQNISIQQRSVVDNFEYTQSATSQLQLHEAPEIISSQKLNTSIQQLSEEDFLEIDDLIGSERNPADVDQHIENFQFDTLDGLNELDLFHDAAMFLREIDQSTVSHPYLNSMDNEVVHNSDYPQNDFDNSNQITSQLWIHDQQNNVAPTESHPSSLSAPQPTSGFACEGNSMNMPQASQNLYNNPGEVAENRLTSALWAFVESIPTTPASASENAFLVNRAFERVSSFRRLRLHGRDTGGTDAAIVRRAHRSRGFLFFSVLGAMCAILWVLIVGPAAGSLGRYINL